MSVKLTSRRWRWAAQVGVAGVFAAVALGAGSAAGQSNESVKAHSMELQTLTGPKGADITLDVTPAEGRVRSRRSKRCS